MTKHAAVAFAEWLAITYGERGLYVACICPMGVDTEMLRSGAHLLEGASVAALPVLTVDEACESIVGGLQEGRFLILTHPETAQYELFRVADRDRWIAGMQRQQKQVLETLRAQGRSTTASAGALATCPPMSRHFTFTAGSRLVRVRCYLHDDSHAPQGWYRPAERVLELSKPFVPA